MNDRFDLPISTNARALDAYIEAVDNLLRAGPDLVAGFSNALVIDPAFALAEIGRARALAIYGDGAAAKASAARARGLAQTLSARERQHVNALALAVDGKAAEALMAIREHLREFPRDALVLQPAVSAFGLIGFSGRIDRAQELLELLDGLAPHYGDDWWFRSIHAYAQVDHGRVTEAERNVERSLELEPRNANAVHVRAHVFYELEQHTAGARFLRQWLADHQQKALLRGHLAWHLALLQLALGNPDSAWILYREEIALPLHQPESARTPPLNVLTDTASFLWRAELDGRQEHAADWQKLSEFGAARFPNAGLPYGDFHSAMVHARADAQDLVKRLQSQLSELAVDRPACATASAVSAGLVAYARQDWSAAAKWLSEAHAEIVRLGGSRAQLDLISRTLVSAYRHAGSQKMAEDMCAARPHLLSAA